MSLWNMYLSAFYEDDILSFLFWSLNILLLLDTLLCPFFTGESNGQTTPPPPIPSPPLPLHPRLSKDITISFLSILSRHPPAQHKPNSTAIAASSRLLHMYKKTHTHVLRHGNSCWPWQLFRPRYRQLRVPYTSWVHQSAAHLCAAPPGVGG